MSDSRKEKKKTFFAFFYVCESCEEEIDQERLAAMPFTKLCLSCQEDLERQ